MKILFKLSVLFVILISVGCTITKRRYISGYSIVWKTKIPSTRMAPQKQSKENFQTQISSCNNKTILALKAENFAFPRNIQTVEYHQQQKNLLKEEILKLHTQSVPDKYIVASLNTIPEHNAPEKDTSKKDVRISWHCFLYAFLSGLVSAYFVLGVLYNNAAVTSIGLLFIIPLVLFIISFIYFYKAIKIGHNWGLIAAMILDILFIILLISIIGSIFFFP